MRSWVDLGEPGAANGMTVLELAVLFLYLIFRAGFPDPSWDMPTK